MRVLATILDNPGEQPHQTRYRDPAELQALGYTDLVIYPTTGLSGLLGPDTPATTDLRQWVGKLCDSVEQTAHDARRAGLDVWVTYDAPTLAAELVGSAMTCDGDADRLCPASDLLLDMIGQCLEALVSRLDPIAGIVLRLGDNDAHRLPHLIGNTIYDPSCSRCGSLGRGDRLVRFISFFHELVVQKLDRTLIVRAWNVRPGGLHDDAELCAEVMPRLPVDDRLILSFKFAQTDFWRYQSWNPSSMACGNRPIIYELQCQREFEGKGAVPNYQAALWRDGMAELDGAVGLAEISQQVNLAGLWAWVRGGGWGGPYIGRDSETWIDANVVAVPQLAAEPTADPRDLAQRWISERAGCDDPQAATALLQALEHSPQTALDSFYIGPYARRRSEPWHPNADLLQDDLLDAQAVWRIIQQLDDADLDEVIAEKQRAVERIDDDRRAMQSAMEHLSPPIGEELAHTLDYASALVKTLHHLLAALVGYRRFLRRGDDNAARRVRDHLERSQRAWSQHQRCAAHRASASAFRSDNLWSLTQQVLDELRPTAPAAR